jgi:phospholipid N-methyltransferase
MPTMDDASNNNVLRESILIFSKFLKSPRTIGAVSPSSRALARMMVADLPRDLPVSVVELGPGTGAFTGAIVDRLTAASQFLAIDIEPDFVRKIRQRWPSVDIVCASAEQLETLVRDRDLAPVDHIISGLPFASLPMAMTRQILEGIEHTLRPGGTFTTFQYVHGYWMPHGRLFRRQMSEIMGTAPRRRLVLSNFPPTYILTWVRHS